MPRGTRDKCYVSVAYSHMASDPRVRRHCESLARAGWRVYQIGLAAEGESRVGVANGVVVLRWPRVRYRGGRILRYALVYGRFLLWARQLLVRIARRRPLRVVQVNNLPNFMVWCARSVQRRGTRVVLDMHDPEPELFVSKWGGRLGAGAGRWALERVERVASRAADATLCVHEPMRLLLERRGTGGARLGVVVNAPDGALFPRLTPRPARPAFVYHGTVAHRMGLDVIVAAIATLVNERRDVRLTILGDGDAVSDLQRLARARDVVDCVRIPGRRFHLEEVLSSLEDAGVGIVPMRRDPFTDLMLPTKLLEYARLGIPAVVTWTPTVAHYFPEDAVYFLRDMTVRDVATTLTRVIDAPHEAAARAARAQGLPIARPWQDLEGDYVEFMAALEREGSGNGRWR